MSNDKKSSTISGIYESLSNHFLNIRQVLEISEEFRKCDTNDKRVFFALSHLEALNLIPDCKLAEKSDEKSISFRHKGNVAYKKRSFFEALELYNKSVAFATSAPTSDCLALAYGNRSALLFEHQYYNETLQDIERALKANYPEDKRAKLLERQEKATSLISKSKTFNFCQKIASSFTPNPLAKCASNKIEVAYSPDQGRFIRATENILVGETIVIEKAFVAILRDRSIHRNCDFCIDCILNPIPCQFCPYAMYCNEECLSKAWNRHHRYECRLFEAMQSLEITKMARLSLRVTISAKDQFIKIAENSEEFQPNEENPLQQGMSLNENGELVFDTNYTGIHHLIQNTSHFKTNELFYKATMAAVVLRILQDNTDFFEHPVVDKETMKTITAELLMRHLQTAPSNMHTLSALVPRIENEFSPRESTRIGDAAYFFSSLFNHSCSPNVTHQHHKSYIVIQTTQNISKGEQIYSNYGMHFAMMPLFDRQFTIKDQYFFDCKCIACVNNWPTFSTMKPNHNSAKATKLSTIVDDIEINGIQAARRWLSTIIKLMRLDKPSDPTFERCMLEETLKECFALEANYYSIYK